MKNWKLRTGGNQINTFKNWKLRSLGNQVNRKKKIKVVVGKEIS